MLTVLYRKQNRVSAPFRQLLKKSGAWSVESGDMVRFARFKFVGACRHIHSTLHTQHSTLLLYSVGETPMTLRKAAANLLALS